MFDALKLALAS